MSTLHRYQPFIKLLLPAILVLWTLLLATLTLLPGSALPESPLLAYDKLGHFGLFGGWTFFLGLYLMIHRRKQQINLLALMTAGIIFGAFIELMQYIMPLDRTASWGDILANTAGCLAATLVLHAIRLYLQKKPSAFSYFFRH